MLIRLPGSLAAYELRHPFERSLAFGSFVLDLNDEDLFLTAGGRPPRRPLPSHGHQPFPAIHAEVNFSPTWQLEDADSDSLSSSESSLSGVLDEGAQMATAVGGGGGGGFGGPIGGGGELGGTIAQRELPHGREGRMDDSSMPADKKLQLKKRRQEKEQRIRLALMGLAPQTTQSAATATVTSTTTDDPPNFKQQPTGSLVTTSVTGFAGHPDPNAVEVYRDLRRRFRLHTPVGRLGMISFDTERQRRDPYMTQVTGVGPRQQLELRHSDPAYHFAGIAVRPFPMYVNRFHRPDFRWGLYELHRKREQAPLKPATTYAGKRAALPAPPLSPTGGPYPVGKLWGPWRINGPQISDVMRRLKCVKAAAATGETEFATPSHPAELLHSVADLTLTDCAPIALLEYAEQSPPLINSIGMVARITKYYRPPVESMTLDQAKKKIRGRLGRLGQLKLADTHVPFFGSQMRLTRNQGVVIFQSRVSKAPLFPHPTNPRAPLRVPPDTVARDWRYGMLRFHDFRGTDFLLIRRPVLSERGEGGDDIADPVGGECETYLRPIYLDPTGPAAVVDADEVYNRADCWVYTVGQTQPLLEVAPPTSKRCLEIRRDWLRAYALRLARQGITDFQAVKARCQEKFQHIFDTGVLQKHLLTCREAAPSSAAPLFVAPGTPALTIKVVDEDQLRGICPPEALCTLEASLVANSILTQAGVSLMRIADTQLASAVREIEAEETHARDKWLKARKHLRATEARYRQILKSLPQGHPLRAAPQRTPPKTWELGGIGGLPHIGTRRLSPIARLIEEMLLLAPWNITKDCLEVTTVCICLHGSSSNVES